MSKQGFLDGARKLFGIPASAEKPASASFDLPEVFDLPEDGSRQERRTRSTENRWPRRFAETELSLAKAGKGGFFKVETSTGEKVVFNIWISPHKGHVDRKGNPVRRIFPKIYDKDGVRIAKVLFTPHGEQGPYFPIGMLYESPVDPERFPKEHREVLEIFMEPLMRGIEEYNEAYKARRNSKRQKSA
ncbi:MAG: hypothetical protein Q7R54_02780 [bacterium]|nr:hypothetical protein [bacterium]